MKSGGGQFSFVSMSRVVAGVFVTAGAIAFAGVALAQSSGPSSFVSCSSEGQNCNTFSTNPVVIQFGNAGDKVFSYGRVQGQAVSCGNSLFGDPDPGKGKACSYKAAGGKAASTMSTCAGEGQTCRTKLSGDGNSYIWGRYGAGNSWVYFYAANDFQCGTNQGPIPNDDPAPGVHKSCQLMPKVITPQGWNVCGNEGTSCALPGSGIYLMKFGNPNVGKWTMREFQSTGATAIQCSNGAFGVDPAPGQPKQCSVVAKSGTGTVQLSTNGKWVQVSSNSGNATAQLTGQFQVGIVSNNETDNESDWNVAVSATVGYNSPEATGGPNGSLTVTAGGGGSTTSSTSNGQSSTLTEGFQCDSTAKSAWQWVMTVTGSDPTCPTARAWRP